MVDASKVLAFANALLAKFEEKATKVTSWGNNPSNDNYPSEKLVKSSLDNKENLSNKITSWGNNPSDTNYPSAKLVKDALDEKLDDTDIPTKTSDLTNDGSDGTHPFLTEDSLDSVEVTLEKQATADTGYASTYVLKQGGTAISPKINIAKDQLLQSASLQTVGSTPSTLETSNSLSAGDKYIKMVVNTENSESGANILVIPVNDLVDDYSADGTTIVLSNGQFSVKAGGINTTQLANNAVTSDKLNSNAVTTAKINDGAVTADKIASAVSDSWVTISDVDSEIEDYLDSLTAALTDE